MRPRFHSALVLSSLALALALAVARFAESQEPHSPARVLLVSFDGAGQEMTSRLIAEGRLPNFERLVTRGAWSDGMVTSFPTKTAAAHAMLFTGYYGHTSGITGNWMLKMPPSEHTRLESTSGYFAGPLHVEPVWVTTARAGLPSYALHATQAYPFGAEAALDSLVVVHGYTETQARARAIDATSLAAPSADWIVPEARGPEAREIAFEVGETRYWGLFFDDPFDPTLGCDTLGIVTARSDEAFRATVKAGEDVSFSAPIRASLSGKDVWFSLRLFSLAPDASELVLFRSGAVEVAVSSPSFLDRHRQVLEAYDGNGGVGPYADGALGTPWARGGDGTAERRLIETEAHLQSQILAQTRTFLSEDYRFVALYSPVIDDIAHRFGGYVDPELAGYDPSLEPEPWSVIAEAFAIEDRLLGELLDAADRDGAHVLVVSDHGMAATNRRLHLNLALEQAGLLALDADRRIDLSRTRALALPLADNSVAVNTVDRLGGIVPMEEKESVIQDVRRALASIQDPDTGERVVLEILAPATKGLIQPGGPGTGDLFVELAPGYEPSTSTRSALVIEPTEPSGTHGYLPTRRDMRAIFGAYGPRVPPGSNLGRVRAIDVVPTVLDLLGLDAPEALPGHSLVPERGLLQ